MIVIVDYRMGNLGSIRNMLKKVGGAATISSDHAEIEDAEKLILPGVGAFDQGMRWLNELGLVPVLNRKVRDDKTPVLGICLGMQLMTKSSEEGREGGIGWIDARTVKFSLNGSGLRVPHMGWNTITLKKPSRIFRDLPEDSRFYFVHSYHALCSDAADALAVTHYGYDFISAFERGNVYGVQFHPEKSHKFGMKLLQNFVELA